MYADNQKILDAEDYYRQGCTSTEAVQIKLKLAAGESPEKLSKTMRLKLACIQSFAEPKAEVTLPPKTPVSAETEAASAQFFGKAKKKR